jgi:hypothetical protein
MAGASRLLQVQTPRFSTGRFFVVGAPAARRTGWLGPHWDQNCPLLDSWLTGSVDYLATSEFVFQHNPACRHVSADVEEEIMGRTPNDDRSDSLNPNNDAYSSSQDNRSDQLNPNNERYQGSDKAESEEEDD